MQLRKLISDDDAVSPVIGVILMVAITVILAAVIATFVLGLGDSVSNNAPQAQLEINSAEDAYSTGTAQDGIEIEHTGGDELTKSNLQINVGGTDALNDNDGNIDHGTTKFADPDSGGSGAVEPSDPITAGDRYVLVETTEGLIQEGDTVRVIWENPNGSNTAVIAKGEVNF